MKTEMRSDLATLNNTMDDMNGSVCDLKSDNESLRQEYEDMMRQIDESSAKVDNIEGQSHRNNIKLYGIYGRIWKAWQDTESFITEMLGLTDLQSRRATSRLKVLIFHCR